MGTLKMNRVLWTGLTVIAVTVLGFWLWWHDVSIDRSYKLEVLEPIKLLKEPPQDYPKTNSEIDQILAGETVEVLRMGYGKDFRAWLVKGTKGQEGWFMEDGKNVRVSKK